MSDVDSDPTVIELTKRLKDAEDAIAAENRDYERAEREGMEEGHASWHYAEIDRLEQERKWATGALARQRGIVEEALSAAGNVVDPTTLGEDIRLARERFERANFEYHQSHPIEDTDKLEHDRDLAAAMVSILTRRQDEAAATDTTDTGHYDDGHAFGWTKTPDDPTDTGHYDDGHAFGWGTKKKVAVAGGIVAAVLAAAAAAIAFAGGGGKSSSAKSDASGAPVIESSSSTSSSSSLEVVTLPLNTVLAGCIAIDPQGNTTVLHPGFLVANPEPGQYTATFATGPTGAVQGVGTAAGNLVVANVTIRAFGAYDGLTLTGPDGAPIALGPIASQLPLDINAQTDKPNGCDPSSLTMPQSGAGSADSDHAAISAFLPQFSHAMQIADVDFLTRSLDPAVLGRYGESQCRADIAAVPADPTANFVLKGFTSGPEPFTYTSDGQSAVVSNTYDVAVSRTATGSTADSSLHLSVDASGAVHWFTDCTH